MMKGRSLLRGAGMLMVVALVSIVGIKAHSSNVTAAPAKQHADVITIDVIGKLGDMELPAVTYRHDLHTDALREMNKDCASCHENKDGNMDLMFKRTGEMSAKELQNLYHQNCVGCHADMAKAGQDTGPLESECRTCHNPNPDVKASALPVNMDKSLHYKHISSKKIIVPQQDKNCGACHMQVDAAKGTATYVPDTEDADNGYGKGPLEYKNPRAAAHSSCISCHMTEAKKDSAFTGPVTCGGCHSVKTEKEMNAVAPERLFRGQPDTTLIVPATSAKSDIAPVAFDHKLHEANVEECSTCHINGIGNKKDGFKPLYSDMHDAKSTASCVGCHAKRITKDASCAGCHTMIPVQNFNEQSCATCHNANGVTAEQAANMSKEERTAVANAVIAAREAGTVTYTADEIPEFVKIDAIADKYEASNMPHRKIVESMLKGTVNSKLAGSFHAEKGKVCQACHHQSPASIKPPKCQSCHNKAFTTGDRPGLKAAFHQQCMTCHTEMNIQKPKNTECAGCHAARAN
ncbi:sulfate respiration complex hexadecaheme cytochrome HmcA [Halodesulfovibrio spirochaetisodalis]|uniref:Class III cytochrome C domain-containing protein n=1 Tax=Halodesulfovibrio spirochaetisodalis TaxID=1560234 RepID=A0A1B7XE08_9BACT|nr:cytochrome c3 family protein [Halodesulfovibrio spirochaetisodalis]OBQ52390.1 hypothetical protein SP90_07380 [Halodesulfovibrio spirochaetisodalis]